MSHSAPLALAIEAASGHRFGRPELADLALTHASTTGRTPRGRLRRDALDNQRLEFLGDRVLALAMARLLMERYPDSSEGALTKRLVVLVAATTLTEVAAELDLARWLRIGDAGAARTAPASGRMLADACEALIGAIFEDGGLDAATAFVRRFWWRRVEAMAEPPRDPKMALQEWALERGLALPAYQVLATGGPPHAPVFEVRALVEGHGAAEAAGSSKRRAEQQAAGLLLGKLEAGRHG